MCTFCRTSSDICVFFFEVRATPEIDPYGHTLSLHDALPFFASGFTITALHNHLLRSSPATMYMHIAGHGDPVKLAAALRQALSASRTPLAAPQSPSASAAASRLDLEIGRAHV